MNVITGEKLELSCDIIIGNKEDFNFNPNLQKLKQKNNIFLELLNINHFIDNKYKVFCYTHLLTNVNLLIVKLKKFKNKFVLFFHNSDCNFSAEHLILFDNLPLLENIYTQNMNVTNNRVFPLPIGIANSMWDHGNLSRWNEILNKKIEKNNDIFFNFSINTNTIIRQNCLNKLLSTNLTFIQNISNQNEYIKLLSSYKFCICPEGNGIDTHRFWECLYLKVIPICLKSHLTVYYSKLLPLILLDDWSNLDINNLDYSKHDWNNYKYLDFITFTNNNYKMIL
jgi:hypothetical protein